MNLKEVNITIGIDATNIGGGGGITHLKELLNSDVLSFQKIFVVLIGSTETLEAIEDQPYLKKISHKNLNRGLINRIFFQTFTLTNLLKKNCHILFSVTGDYTGKFKPVIGMSRNMLLYERDIWREIKQPKEILRFWLNYKKQKRCFKNSSGIIFISNYAKEVISKKINLSNKKTAVIHHGVSSRFNGVAKDQKNISNYTLENPFKFLYVSTVHVYKHQWNVVVAISNLRKLGYPVTLDLVGGSIFNPAMKKLNETIKKVDPNSVFIKNNGHISYETINKFYSKTDGIVYASTCENMPNILMESMASGIPIACSNKQPMPEFLKDNGFYFNATDITSIEAALIDFLENPDQRKINSENALNEVKKYSWYKTAKETIDFVTKININ